MSSIFVGTVGVATTIAGTGLAAYGQLQQGHAQQQDIYRQQQAMYGQRQNALDQQAIADYNARVAQLEARSIESATIFKQQRQAQLASRRQSSFLATAGTSGVVPSEGAPVRAMQAQAAEDELDMLLMGYEGRVAASRARSQAAMDTMQGQVYGRQAGLYGQQASLIGQQAQNVGRASRIAAGTTLLQGFGSLAAQYRR
jgi:hypothetical protein